MVGMNKIFGIGFPKTGTTSLTVALRQTGLNIKHLPLPLESMVPLIKQLDGATESSVACCYKYLDGVFGNSKFILTIREEESWMTSCRHHFLERHPQEQWFVGFSDLHRGVWQALVGVDKFNEKIWRDAYKRHNENVVEHFRYRPNALLVLNIEAGQGWKELYEFLKIDDIPNRPFPHANARPQK